MNNKRVWFGAALVVGMLLLGCSNHQAVVEEQDPSQFFIAAYTSGAISCKSVIQVEFTQDMAAGNKINESISPSPLEFRPEIKGDAVWINRRTLEFRPQSPLPEGKEFTALLNINRIMENFGRVAQFKFHFITMKQSFEISLEELQAINDTDLTSQVLKGQLITADVANPNKVELVLNATQAGKNLDIQWQHDPDGRQHLFQIGGIVRSETPSEVTFTWDGVALGVNKKGERIIVVTPLSSFTVLEGKPVQEKERCLEIIFNDPLKKGQNLLGLIRVEGHPDLKFTIDRNSVRIYSALPWGDKVEVILEPSIQNVMGRRLNIRKTLSVFFGPVKPEVRFVGKGVIVPTTQGLTIPFEAVNLRAVTVEAFKVFEGNLPQFFQVNALDGNYELRRVGRVVWKKTIPLSWTADKTNRWLRYGLDLNPLLQADQGGMVRLKLSFDRRDIVYPCTEPPPPAREEEEEASAKNDDNQEGGEYYEDYYEGDEYHNLYENRQNPCSPGYYRKYYDHNIAPERNILISDIGLTAKKGSSDELFIAATDLRSTEPLAGLDFKVLDFQLQEIASGKTDNNGMAFIRLTRAPFLVAARKGMQSGYLKVDDGSALAVSHFDIAGETVKKGIKGFLYGERGVWRPGDTLYLTFILLDRERRLPADHPVKFELVNPKGQVVKTIIKKDSLNGFYLFKTETAADAPTGNWIARVKAGGSVFEKVLKIETVMPNRLKIALNFGPQIKSLVAGPLTGALSAAWLHGAPARNLKADINLAFSSAPTVFPGFEKYVFDDPTKKYETEETQLFEGRLDEQGKTAINTNIQAEKVSPGRLNANFRVRVFEPSGAFSIDRFSLPFHPYRRYVGIYLPEAEKTGDLLVTDQYHTVKIAALDYLGQPLLTGSVEVKMYKINWRWWWEREEQADANFVASTEYQTIKTETVPIKNGSGEWRFKIDYPAWGRYLIKVTDLGGAHVSGKIVYLDWPEWAGRPWESESGGAAVLNYSADKDEYKVGEKAVLNIPTGKKGRGLLTVESGSKIISAAWFEAKGETTRYELPITAAMTPNIYVYISFLQPHLQTGNDLPLRLYGVIPLKVIDPATRLRPQLGAPAEMHPETKAKLTISEATGRRMTYTVAVVDEGLLDLTRFATPDPWAEFFKREALGVKSWDLYDYVAGAYGGVLEQILAVGGDERIVSQANKKAQRFPPMVVFMGPFELKAGARNNHEFIVPQYVGSVRIMVVAGQDGAFGCVDKAVPVRKPLMILGTLPRTLGANEEVDLPVSVFAMEPKVKDVKVSVKVSGAASLAGPDAQKLAFKTPGEDMVTFKLKTGSTFGIVKVNINAASGNQTATHSIELDVRSPEGPVTDVASGTILKNEVWQKEIKLLGMPGTNHALLEISRIPPLNLGKRLGFLIEYPHGCVEQTTSAVFPQLYLNKLLKLTSERQNAVERNIKAGIERLRSFQTPDGGFGYWPGERSAEEWASNYAGHFLVEAEKNGYQIPVGLLDGWKGYQRARAVSWVTGPAHSELIQAYRLYTLALANAPEYGSMNRLKETPGMSAETKWRLAAAYQLAGQPEAARRLTDRAPLTVPPYRELCNTFGSDLRDKAMILESLALMNQTKRALPLMQELSRELCSDKWISTQSTAYTLIAMARFAGVAAGPGRMNLSYSWSKEKEKAITADAAIFQQELAPGNNLTGALRIKNLGETPLFVRLILKGVPPFGMETAAENGIGLKVEYLNLKGERIDPGRLTQGTDLVAEVTVKNPGNKGEYDELILAQIIPSGWEIHNLRMDMPGETEVKRNYDYQDVRDDRLYTYFDLDGGKSKTFRVVLNASYLGKFYLPPVRVEAMYDATLNARVPGRWVTVVPAGN